jgi:hypothetical protein
VAPNAVEEGGGERVAKKEARTERVSGGAAGILSNTYACSVFAGMEVTSERRALGVGGTAGIEGPGSVRRNQSFERGFGGERACETAEVLSQQLLGRLTEDFVQCLYSNLVWLL